MKRFVALVLVALFAGLPRVHADGPDDQYLQIYYLVQEADSLSSSGQPARALDAIDLAVLKSCVRWAIRCWMACMSGLAMTPVAGGAPAG